MAKRLFTNTLASWAATATNATATNWMGIKGGTTTQLIDILEVLISGQAAASAVGGFIVTLSSTLAATPTALASPAADAPLNPSATALANVVVTHTAATTGPTPSNATTAPKVNLGLNLFGGLIRWNAAPGQQFNTVGNATNGGEAVLFNSSTYQGATAGPATAHIIYEPY